MPVFNPAQVRVLSSVVIFKQSPASVHPNVYCHVHTQISSNHPGSWGNNVSTAAAAYAPVYAHFTAFLVQGVTIRPPTLGVASMTSWIMEKGVQTPVSLMAASSGAFTSASDRTSAAVIVASIADAALNVTLSLSSEGWAGGLTTLYDGVHRTVLRTWSTLPQGTFTLTFSRACEVQVLLVENATVPQPRRMHTAARDSQPMEH
jgi:hypothetical protein